MASFTLDARGFDETVRLVRDVREVIEAIRSGDMLSGGAAEMLEAALDRFTEPARNRPLPPLA